MEGAFFCTEGKEFGERDLNLELYSSFSAQLNTSKELCELRKFNNNKRTEKNQKKSTTNHTFNKMLSDDRHDHPS